MKGQDSYQSKTKEMWRGWQWNRIAELLGPEKFKLKDKTVLYLVGPEDKDRDCAVRRGFRSDNCIAVDIDVDRIKQVRRSGGVGICGSLHQVIANWPSDQVIDVVVADFCHGLTKDAMLLPNIFNSCPGIGMHTVVAINLMRGRDSDSNELRSMLVDRIASCPDGPMKDLAITFSKDRGFLFIERVIQMVLTFANELSQSVNGCFLDDDVIRLIYGDTYIRMCPSMYDYKSPESGHIFDSVVFRWPIEFGKCIDSAARDRVKSSGLGGLSKAAQRPGRVKQKLAALRAVRTMREKGVRR